MAISTALLKHKASGDSPEEFTAQWTRSSPLLQPLADAINEMVAGMSQVDPADFSVANHYAKLAYEAGQRAMAARILALLPEGVDR